MASISSTRSISFIPFSQTFVKGDTSITCTLSEMAESHRTPPIPKEILELAPPPPINLKASGADKYPAIVAKWQEYDGKRVRVTLSGLCIEPTVVLSIEEYRKLYAESWELYHEVKALESSLVENNTQELRDLSVATRMSVVSSAMRSSNSVLSTCQNSATSSHASPSILRSQNRVDLVERTDAPAKTVRFADHIPVSRDLLKLENVSLGIRGCETLIMKDEDLNHYPPEVQIELRKVNQGTEALKAAFERINENLVEYSSQDIENYMYGLYLLILEKQRYINSITVSKKERLKAASEVQVSSPIASSSSAHSRDSDAARIGIIVKAIQQIPAGLNEESFLAKNAVQEYNKERELFLKSANAAIDHIEEIEYSNIIKITILADNLKKSHAQVFMLEAILQVREQIPQVLDVNLFVGLAKCAAEEYNRKRAEFITDANAKIKHILTPKVVEAIVDHAKKLKDYWEFVFKMNKRQLNVLGRISYTRPPKQAEIVGEVNGKKSVEKKGNATSQCSGQVKRRRNAITPEDFLFNLTEFEKERLRKISELRKLKKDKRESKSREEVRVHDVAGICLGEPASANLKSKREQAPGVSLKYRTSEEQEFPTPAAPLPTIAEANLELRSNANESSSI